MKTVLSLLLLLAGTTLGQISHVTLPHIIDSATIPQVSYVDDNDNALQDGHNVVVDTVNALKAGTAAFSGLTASRLMSTNASKQPASVSDLTSWIAGTASQITSTSDGDGTLTLSLPSAVTFPGAVTVTGNVTVSNVTANRILYLNGSKVASGSADLAYDGTTITLGTNTITAASGNTAIAGTLGVSGVQTNAADLAFSPTDALIRSNTSDASDNKSVAIGGGGALPNTRGASGLFVGNEYPSIGGRIYLEAGNVSTGEIRLLTGNQVRLTIANDGTQTFASPVSLTGVTTLSNTLNATDVISTVTDNSTGVLVVKEGSNDYIRLTTTNSSELLNFGNTTTNPSMSFLGTGTKAFSGPVTAASTLGVTGVATFTAAPVFSSVTASQFLLVDGSKALTSVAGTGSGSVVRATSPTLVTPVLGVASATTLALGGNEAFDYDEGSFTGTLTGVSGTVTGTCYYTRIGKAVTLYIPDLTGTSNTTACTITGLPVALRPARSQWITVDPIKDGVSSYLGQVEIQTDGDIALLIRSSLTVGTSYAFTNSGTKGILTTTVTYTLQ